MSHTAHRLIVGSVLFSLGYSLPLLVGVSGVYRCASGDSGACPYILSLVPVFGLPIGAAWSEAITPVPAGAVDDASTLLLLGSIFMGAIEIVGAAIFVHGELGARTDPTRTQPSARLRWMLAPGPTPLGLSIAAYVDTR